MKLRDVLLIVPAALLLVGAGAKPSCACSNRELAYVPAMKSDLKTLSTAQEAFWADSSRYAASFTELTPVRFRPSAGVTVVLDSGNARGWSAHASHVAIPATCAMLYLVDGAAPENGVPICTNVATATQVAHRYRFFAFVVITALVGVTAAVAHRSWKPFVVLLVLCGLNPFWMDPDAGMDCGQIVRTMSMLWLFVAFGLAVWQWVRPPVQPLTTLSELP